MRPKFKTVLFDLDDTLVKAHEHIFRAFNHSLEKNGFAKISEADLSAIAGVPLHKCYEKFAGSKVEQLVEDHRKFQVQHMDLIEKYAGVDELLQKLRESGVKTAIVTARYRNTTDLIVKQTGLGKLVDKVVAGDDFPEGKPHPRPFLEAAKQVGVLPKECLVVGDGCADIAGGNAAGSKTCRALYGYGASQECGVKSDFEASLPLEVLAIVLG